MHIAYLIPTVDKIGGAERQVLLLATGMAARGCRVTLFALSGTGANVATSLSESGVSFQSLRMRKGILDPRGWIQLHRWIRSNEPDILHAHLPHAVLLSRWSRAFAPVPVLIDTLHSPNTGGFLRRIGYALSSRLPNVVTAVSSSVAEPWLNAHLVNAEAFSLVPNGVDLDHWKPDTDLRRTLQFLNLSPKFSWLAVGRLDPVKDHATLLQAFSLLPRHAHLTIAGTGPLKNHLRSLASTLGVVDRVSFVGFQENLLPLMQESDAFVLTSRWEGLPVALLEASACGLPAIFTDTPGSREVLPGSFGSCVAAGHPEALATAMNTMMELSSSERRQIGNRARSRVAEHFSLDALLDRYELLYRHTFEINPLPGRWRSRNQLSSEPFRSNTTKT